MSNDYKSALNSLDDDLDSPNSVEMTEKPIVNISKSIMQGGWQQIDKSLLAYGGVYYPDSITISVKPFSTKEVVYFTSINENNPLEVDQAMIYLVENCIQVRNGNKVLKAVDVIFNFDRFPLILLARTYSDMRTDLTFDHKCTNDKCSKTSTYRIIPQSLVFTDNKLDKYYNNKSGNFSIKTESDNNEGFAIYEYRPLTINENRELFDFIVEKREELDSSDLKVFIKFYPFLRNYMTEKTTISDVYFNFMDLNKTQIEDISLLLDYVLDSTTSISVKCKHCGNNGGIPMKFPNGLRTLVVDKVKGHNILL